MNYVKKIIGVLLGTMFLGMGVAFYKISQFGQDGVSAMVMSFVYLFKLGETNYGYTVCYLAINCIFLVIMILTLKDKINVGSIINLLLTGVCSNLFIYLFEVLSFNNNAIALRILYSVLGIITVSFGIALYGSANLGVAPYDAMPMVINKYCPKIAYKYARIICDLSCLVVALIIGVIILRRSDIINVNTVITFITIGPLISFFSKIINKYIYKRCDIIKYVEAIEVYNEKAKRSKCIYPHTLG